MSTPPPHPDQRNNGLTNSYDPASTIRFEEPRRLPIGLIAAVLGGFLLACGIIFVVMYKVNVGPAPHRGHRTPTWHAAARALGQQGHHRRAGTEEGHSHRRRHSRHRTRHQW